MTGTKTAIAESYAELYGEARIKIAKLEAENQRLRHEFSEFVGNIESLYLLDEPAFTALTKAQKALEMSDG